MQTFVLFHTSADQRAAGSLTDSTTVLKSKIGINKSTKMSRAELQII